MSMKNQNISFNHPSNYQRDLKIKSLFLSINTIKDQRWNIIYIFQGKSIFLCSRIRYSSWMVTSSNICNRLNSKLSEHRTLDQTFVKINGNVIAARIAKLQTIDIVVAAMHIEPHFARKTFQIESQNKHLTIYEVQMTSRLFLTICTFIETVVFECKIVLNFNFVWRPEAIFSAIIALL
jgi:hypothetical protein